MKIEKVKNYRNDILALLASEKLPVSDLPETLENFFVAVEDGKVIGVIGLETYGNYGLLRSLAVGSETRSKGIAGYLIQHLESAALTASLKEVYLLTETAAAYFSRKGYRQISRLDVPAILHQSSEFSHVCPASAIVMKKILK